MLVILACVITALICTPILRVEVRAIWSGGRRAAAAILTAAIAFGYLLGRRPGDPSATPPCTPITTPCITLTPTPHQVDHAPPYLLDPLPAPVPSDLGSGAAPDSVADRVRELDVRAFERRR